MTPTDPIPELSVRDRHLAFFVFGLLFSCYLLTYTGLFQSSDGMAMFTTAESIVRRGALDSNQILWMDVQQGSFGPDGNLYNRKGIGLTLLALPFVWLAKLWPAAGLVQAALLVNPILTAWTGGLIYRSGRRLAWGRAASLVTALVFGLATLAWPYTQTFFSDPLSGWGLFAAFYGLLAFRQSGLKRYLLLGGMAWGLAYLGRVVNLLTLPVYLVALTYVIGRRYQAHIGDMVRHLWSLLIHNWRPFASFMIPVVAAGALSLWWNWARFGSIWTTGYLESESFSGDWLFGIYGLLVSPGRGLLWYSPVLLLAIPGGIWFARYKPWVLAMSAAIIAMYVLVYGKWYMWHGGFSWGPRFVVPTLPFLTLLTGPVFVWVLNSTAQRGLRWLVGILTLLLCVLSVAVQWLGMSAPFILVQDLLVQRVEPLFAPDTFTQWRYSPLLLQWQFLTVNNAPFWWWQPANGGDAINWLGLAALCLGILAGLILLLRTLLGTEENGRSMGIGLYSVALVVLALLIVQYENLSTPQNQSLEQTADSIQRREQELDAILFLRPEQTQQFANVYHGNLPTYGLMPQGELDESSAAWLTRLRADHQRLWVAPNATSPDGSGWEQTLRANDFLLWEHSATQEDDMRLALYAMAESQSLVETGLGVIFGAPESAGSEITPASGWIRLNGYSLTGETPANGQIVLALQWESLQAVDTDYHVFVHVLDHSGQRVAQRDGQPVLWTRPISTWDPGEVIIDRYGLLLPDDFSPGTYTVSVGLYDPVSGQRLPVSAGTGEYAVELGPIVVLPDAN